MNRNARHYDHATGIPPRADVGFAPQWGGRLQHPPVFTPCLDLIGFHANLPKLEWAEIRTVKMAETEDPSVPRPIETLADVPHYCLQTYEKSTGKRFNIWLIAENLKIHDNTFEGEVMIKQLGGWITAVLNEFRENGRELSLKMSADFDPTYRPSGWGMVEPDPEAKKEKLTEAELHERMIESTANQLIGILASIGTAPRARYMPDEFKSKHNPKTDEVEYMLDMCLPRGFNFRVGKYATNPGAMVPSRFGERGTVRGTLKWFGQDYDFVFSSFSLGDQIEYLVSHSLLSRIANGRYEEMFPMLVDEGRLELHFDKRGPADEQ